MIDHTSIGVRDLVRATHFYESLLGAIGYEKIEVLSATVGFGKKYPEFWLNLRPNMVKLPPDSGAHVCLRVHSTDLVELFHSTKTNC